MTIEVFLCDISEILYEKKTRTKIYSTIKDIYRIRELENRQFDDTLRTVTGENLIKYIISKRFKVNKEILKIKRKQYGKPYIENFEDFNYNISHSHNLVVCAISNRSIGIDVEYITFIDLEIATVFFHKKERDYIFHSKDKTLNLLNFYKVWTAKESYLKNIGKGLFIDLDSFSVVSHNNEFELIENNKYKFHQKVLNGNYVISLCVEEDINTVKITNVPISLLI